MRRASESHRNASEQGGNGGTRFARPVESATPRHNNALVGDAHPTRLTLDLIRAMVEKKPERVVCLDEGFAGNDQLKANAVQIFKTKGVTSFKTVQLDRGTEALVAL